MYILKAILAIAVLTLIASFMTGCSYNLDTNGYQSKGSGSKAECVKTGNNYIKCQDTK
jgi:hypothetical protein